MVYGLVGEAREELFGRLLMVRISADQEVDVKQVPPIDWDKMVDQVSESEVGWSFLDDERNSLPCASSGGYMSGCSKNNGYGSSLYTQREG
jgi:hypothetical protein